MPLYLDTGFYSARDARRDERTCLVLMPTSEHEIGHGALFAVAKSLSAGPDADDTSRDALKALGEHYYAAPDNWGLKHALQESLFAANSALADGSETRATALSALVLRRRRWAVSHAGHTRVWLLRDKTLKLLTHDHVTPRLKRAPQIDRAVGLGPQIDPEFVAGELAEGDVFVLTTPEVHDVLNGTEILACAVADVSMAQAAAMLIDRAVKAGGGEGACAGLVRVEQVPPEAREDLEEDVAALPAVAPPAVGDIIDGFRIERLVHKSSRFRLYKAIDLQSNDVVALKFPNPRDAKDPAFAERFLREEWIGRRVSSAYLVRTLPLKKGRRSVLYSVMAYPTGESLARKLARKGALALHDASFIASQLLEALAQIHDQGIIHNDVRPQNILLERSGHLMLLGLGGSHVAHTSTADTDNQSASRRGSFLAPELFDTSVEPTIRSDIFAAGVTIYRMLTGKYPYGKIVAIGQGPDGEYTPATHHRHDVPEALDRALQRACALDANERFESAQEFAETVDAVMAQHAVPRAIPPPSPPAPVRRWNWEMVAVGGLVLVLLVYLVLALRK